MDQKALWNKKWRKVKENLPESSFAKHASAFFPPRGKMLELGCGSGRDTTFFLSKGYEVTAVDFSQVALQFIKENVVGNPTLLCQDLRHLKIDETFDVIYSDRGLHFFNDKDTRKIFNDILNLAKPGAILAIRCKSTKDSLYGKGDKIEKDMFANEGKIRHFFSPNYFKELLGGFEIIEIKENVKRHERIDLPDIMAGLVNVIAKKL